MLLKGCRDFKPLLTRTQSQHSLQTGPDRRDNPRLSPDRPRPAPESPRQAQDRLKTGPSHVKTIQDGPKTSQDRLNFEAQAFKKTFACEGFRDFSTFQEYPKTRQPPGTSKDARTAENRPKTALKQLQHSQRQDQADQDRPSTAQHRPNTCQDRLTFEAKHFE